MTDLPEGDTFCTLHDGPTGGHFMHLTRRTYRRTLHAPYMVDLSLDTSCTLHDDAYQRDTSCTLHELTYLGTLEEIDQKALLPDPSVTFHAHQTLLFLIHIKKTLIFLFIC